MCWLASRGRCLPYLIQTRCKVDQRPDVIPARAGKKLIDLLNRASCEFFAKLFWPAPQFTKNVGCSHGGILNIRPCFSLETQCLIEVKDNNRCPGKLEQEIAERGNGNLMGDSLLLFFTQVLMA